MTKWKREHDDDLRQLRDEVRELRAACDELRGGLAVLRNYIDHRWEMERAKLLEAMGDDLDRRDGLGSGK